MKKIFFNALIKMLYVVMGMIAGIILSLKTVKNDTSGIIYISSIQSCYFSLTKKTNIDDQSKSEFCKKHSEMMTNTFNSVKL